VSHCHRHISVHAWSRCSIVVTPVIQYCEAWAYRLLMLRFVWAYRCINLPAFTSRERDTILARWGEVRDVRGEWGNGWGTVWLIGLVMHCSFIHSNWSHGCKLLYWGAPVACLATGHMSFEHVDQYSQNFFAHKNFNTRKAKVLQLLVGFAIRLCTGVLPLCFSLYLAGWPQASILYSILQIFFQKASI